MENVFVKPAVAGAMVRDPDTGKPLDASGEWKELSPYWARRIRDLDVEAVEPPRETAPKAETESAAGNAA